MHFATLVRYELASVCVAKRIRYPGHATEIEQRYLPLDRLALALHEPDWAALPTLARRRQISAYDAAYLQLALARDAPLVTLDARLAAAWDHAFSAR